MPVKTGIQNMLIILDSPVSSTGQAQSRASLALNDKKVIVTQPPGGTSHKCLDVTKIFLTPGRAHFILRAPNGGS